MRRVLANAVVTAGLLVTVCLPAQPRGAPHASFARSAGGYRSYPTAPRPRPVSRPIRAVTSSSNSSSRPYLRAWQIPPLTGTSLINYGQNSCLLNPSYAGSPYCRQFYPGGPGYGVEPVYPYWMPSTGYQSEESAPPAPEPEPDPQLAAQVGTLATEVELMREDQARRDFQGAPAEPYGAAGEKPPTTLLVYRDGRQVEVQDYAILGKTLWVFSNQTARQVPLADLDLGATERLNGDRGVEFVPPNPL